MPPSAIALLILELTRSQAELELALAVPRQRRTAQEKLPLARRELEHSAEVDALCRALAKHMASNLQNPHKQRTGLSGPEEMRDLLHQRILDALSFLRERTSVPTGWPEEPQKLFAFLLVEGWHRYAEAFWKHRAERTCPELLR